MRMTSSANSPPITRGQTSSSSSSTCTAAPSPSPPSTLAPTPFAPEPTNTISAPMRRTSLAPRTSPESTAPDANTPSSPDTTTPARRSSSASWPKSAFRPPPIALRTPSARSSISTPSHASPSPPTSAATSATRLVTSAPNALLANAPGICASLVSKVEISPLPTASSLPSRSSLISRFATCPSCTISYPRCVRPLCSSLYFFCSLDCAAVYTIPLPPPRSRSFLPSSYSLDILSRASLAMCHLVSICTSDTDCPSSYQLSHSRFISDRRPHYLIITFPSCTLRVCSFSDVFLTRFTLRVPPTIQPPPDARPSLMRRF